MQITDRVALCVCGYIDKCFQCFSDDHEKLQLDIF